MKTKAIGITFTLMSSLGMLAACQNTPVEPVAQADKDYLKQDAEGTLAVWERDYPAAISRMHEAYGYAIFPSVKKGAVGVGGAYGRGMVYEQGNFSSSRQTIRSLSVASLV